METDEIISYSIQMLDRYILYSQLKIEVKLTDVCYPVLSDPIETQL